MALWRDREKRSSFSSPEIFTSDLPLGPLLKWDPATGSKVGRGPKGCRYLYGCNISSRMPLCWSPGMARLLAVQSAGVRG